jgi:dolichol-phosphate mannosyltransferase/undecaprenyl-phosphate 4-deoxy-4-formamido-L-arabinose transferase
VPVSNGSRTLESSVERLKTVLADATEDAYEIVLVDDGSEDDSWEIMRNLSTKPPGLTAVRLTRNFGQHNAVMCGFSQTSGDFVITIEGLLGWYTTRVGGVSIAPRALPDTR